MPRASIYTMTDRQKLLTLPEMDELRMTEDFRMSAEGLALDQRIHLLAAQGRWISIPSSRESIVVREFDLIGALEEADVDDLFVASLPVRAAEKGKPYEYKVDVKSRRGAVKYKVESGPDGMTLSDDGVLRWTPPEDVAETTTGVVLATGDASGLEVFHSYVIQVR